jgi:hypothetical protein
MRGIEQGTLVAPQRFQGPAPAPIAPDPAISNIPLPGASAGAPAPAALRPAPMTEIPKWSSQSGSAQPIETVKPVAAQLTTPTMRKPPDPVAHRQPRSSQMPPSWRQPLCDRRPAIFEVACGPAGYRKLCGPVRDRSRWHIQGASGGFAGHAANRRVWVIGRPAINGINLPAVPEGWRHLSGLPRRRLTRRLTKRGDRQQATQFLPRTSKARGDGTDGNVLGSCDFLVRDAFNVGEVNRSL